MTTYIARGLGCQSHSGRIPTLHRCSFIMFILTFADINGYADLVSEIFLRLFYSRVKIFLIFSSLYVVHDVHTAPPWQSLFSFSY